ncbi:hypothetical protein [uncultured Sphingomonas sp.]|uniref:hypothetical protein n=1 Tax=uncultured Sphingomonas sp. TaxID=158754 RepID=UPI003749E385
MSTPVRTGQIAGLIFVLVWLSCAWFGSWEWNPNNATRIFATMSIVEDGDATIDQFDGLTMDKARFGDHVYSDKAPGMTLLAIPAVVVANAGSGTTSHDMSLSMYDGPSSDFLRLRVRLAAISTSALLTAVGAVAVFLLAVGLGATSGAGVFAAVAFALGTPMWGWSTTIFGHAATTALLAIALWAIWRGTDGDRPDAQMATIAGAALGAAVVIEFSALVTGFAVGGLALWRLRRFPAAEIRRIAIAAAIPALVALTVLVGYNLFAFGTPFRLGYQGVVGFDGMNQGLFGLTYPKPDVLWEITFGTRRGVLWVAPVAVVGLFGLALLARAPTTRALGVTGLAGVAIALCYNAAYVYWDGGNSTGPRHLMPAMAYLSLGFAPAWMWARTALWRDILSLVLAASVGVNLVIASAEIATGGRDDFPLWTDVFTRFSNNDLRTIPSEWFGWSPAAGFWLYVVLAAGLSAALVRAVRSPR